MSLHQCVIRSTVSFILLPQLPRQILRLQVCVPAQHTQILVAGDAGHFHDVEAFLEQPGGGLVTQVVKVQIPDAGAVCRAPECAFDRFGGETGEDRTMQAAGLGAQDPDGGGGERHGA